MHLPLPDNCSIYHTNGSNGLPYVKYYGSLSCEICLPKRKGGVYYLLLLRGKPLLIGITLLGKHISFFPSTSGLLQKYFGFRRWLIVTVRTADYGLFLSLSSDFTILNCTFNSGSCYRWHIIHRQTTSSAVYISALHRFLPFLISIIIFIAYLIDQSSTAQLACSTVTVHAFRIYHAATPKWLLTMILYYYILLTAIAHKDPLTSQ